MDPSSLIEKLVTRGLVSDAAISELSQSEQFGGRSIESVLVEEGLIEEHELLQVMADTYNLPLVSLSPEILDSSLASELPRKLLENFCVFPLQRCEHESRLQLATVDPFDVTAADLFRLKTGREVSYVLAPKAQIVQAIQGKLMGTEGFRLLVDQVPDLPEWNEIETLVETELSKNAPPIIKLVDSLLRDACRRNASDIHMEPQEDHFRVRYRIDGILRTIVELPLRVERTCVSRIKIMAGLNISENRKPQDGRISINLDRRKVHLRVSTVASQLGEKVVLRILDQSSVQLDLGQLGLRKRDLQVLEAHIRSSSGMVLITGPTGSGKTSTLYACLRLLNDASVNITTVEDPVEYQIPGLTQVGVNPRAGITFDNALRAFLRQDPDIIMVGEIRDKTTAETAVQAAQSGHLVFSTLHTNDAPGTLARLVLMGIQPHQITGSLLCVVAQRLVRRNCSDCMKETEITQEQAILLNLSVQKTRPRRLFRGEGCEKCGHTGYRGRVGVYEILTMTTTLRQQLLLDPDYGSLLKAAQEEGMISLLEDGIAKVESGLTTLDEVLRVITIQRESGKPANAHPIVVEPPGAPKTVGQVMTRTVTSVHPNDSLSEVFHVLLHRRISGAPVVDDDGKPLGVVSYCDLASQHWNGGRGRKKATARDAMSGNLTTVNSDDSLSVAAQRMWRHRVHRVLVLEDGQLVGILTPFDLMPYTSLLKEER